MDIDRPVSRQPIPDHAQKVFEGEVFDTYQWKQTMYDGSVALFEKVKRPDTVVVFPVTPQGKMLLSRQEQPGKIPFIGAFGGKIEVGETVIQAAQRELLEESGYMAESFTLWKSLQPISKVEWCVYILIAHDVQQNTNQSLDAGEKIEIMQVEFDKFLDIAYQDNFAEQEVVPDIIEAYYDVNKKRDLQSMFFKGMPKKLYL